MASSLPIPEIDTVSAEWLTHVLKGAGFAGAEVESFTTRRVGTGQAALCCRIEIAYRNPDPSYPASMVAKFAAQDPQSRQGGHDNQTYLREVNFYRQMKDLFTIRTPRCYHAEIESDGPAFALLLEDLAPADQGDQIAGCSPEVAAEAIRNLVGLHAPAWRNSAILDVDWLAGSRSPERAKTVMGFYQRALPHFKERCGPHLEADELALIERIGRGTQFPSETPMITNYTLVHNDYRLDNLLIDESGPAPMIHVVDWQTMAVGNPMKDVSYFLGGCLLPDQRAALERGLVEDYHRRLIDAGVADYGWDACWSDYRRSSLHGIMTALAGMLFVTKTERGDQLFAIMAQRHARQALDIGVDDFLA